MTDVLSEPRATAPPEDREVEDLAGELDRAVADLAHLDDEARHTADAYKQATDDLHRAALVQIVRQLRADPRGKELLFELVDDPRVRMVLMLHELIRPDPGALVNQALAGIRPQLQSHGGDVSLDRISDGVVYVKLAGACNGCSMSAVTMRNGVEEAIIGQVPGITAVEVVPNDPGPALIPLGDIGMRPPDDAGPGPGWAQAGPITEFELGELQVRELTAEGHSVEAVVVNIGGQLAAYVNNCPHLGNSLDDAEIDPVEGTLTCSWHGFCFDALSGECHTLPVAQLAQLPLRVDNGTVWVRVEG